MIGSQVRLVWAFLTAFEASGCRLLAADWGGVAGGGADGMADLADLRAPVLSEVWLQVIDLFRPQGTKELGQGLMDSPGVWEKGVVVKT